MKKNYNNKKVKKTPYEIKQNTAYFVKNRLPAFILAFFIIFWTIASIFGIIAFVKTKKEDKQGVITASADATYPSYLLTDFTVELPFFTGLYGLGTMLGDGAFLQFEGQRVYFVPNGYREDFFANDSSILDRSDFLLTNTQGQSLGEVFFPLNFFPLISDAGLNDFTVTSSNFALSQSAYDYYCFDSYTLSVERFGYNKVNYYFTLPILFYLNGQLENQGSFSIQFYFDFAVPSGSNPIACPYFGFYSTLPAISNTVLGTDNSISNYDLAYFYFEYNKTYAMYQNAVNSLNSSQFEYLQVLNELSAVREQYEVLQITYNDAVSSNRALLEQNQDLQSQIQQLNQDIADLHLRISASYTEGRNAGYVNGYDTGYVDGVANSNTYSFTGLLSAVFDVPVRTFTSLFNFDLLGINLANFFLSLLTCAIVLTVIRWIL